MSVYIPVQLRQQIIECDHARCAYCQSPEALMGVTFEIEHILPLSLGGETIFDNLCFSCPTCNRHKANRIVALDPETDTEIPIFHPRKQHWNDHFAWNENVVTLIGTTAAGRATMEMLQMNRPVIVQLRRYWVALKLHPPE
jgi:5-methylcytosine-specific restriction endonuclease McrA